MTEMGGTSAAPCASLLQQTSEDYFDKSKCIICQKDSKENLTSTKNGQKRVQDAAKIREDIVLKRLKMMNAEDQMVYHCNNKCYKRYTMEKSLRKIAEGKSEVTEMSTEEELSQHSSSTGPKRRSMSNPCPPPSRETPDNLNCIICGFVRANSKRTKYRISTSDRANMFLAAASFFKDEVFDRVADLNSDNHVFAANLYAHPNCIRAYLRRYEKS